MIPEEPKIAGKNSAGTPLWKPAGAAIWTSPTLDVAKNTIYVATGNAYTLRRRRRATPSIALDMTTGKILWSQQVTPNDVFVIGCKPGVENCPTMSAPISTSATRRSCGRCRAAVACSSLGQKSGVVYGLAPDEKGKIIWQYRAGKGGALGGIEWGSAADDQNIYVPVSDVLAPSEQAGGLFAMRLATGERSGTRRRPRSPARRPRLHRRAVGGDQRDAGRGVFRIDRRPLPRLLDRDGKIIWDFNTMQPFETVNGVKAKADR